MLVRSSWWTRTDRRTVTFDPAQDVDCATVAVEHAQQSHGLTTRRAGRWTALEDPLDQGCPANPPAVTARGLLRGRSRCGHDVGAGSGARCEHAMWHVRTRQRVLPLGSPPRLRERSTRASADAWSLRLGGDGPMRLRRSHAARRSTNTLGSSVTPTVPFFQGRLKRTCTRPSSVHASRSRQTPGRPAYRSNCSRP